MTGKGRFIHKIKLILCPKDIVMIVFPSILFE